jgi:hypothetical protein
METKIRYLGIKKRASFNLCPTVIFNGNGDVQSVPNSVVSEMIKYPCFELADDGVSVAEIHDKAEKNKLRDNDIDNIEESSKPPMVNLETMNEVELREYAQRYFNHQFHHKTGAAKMRDTIIGLMNRG